MPDLLSIILRPIGFFVGAWLSLWTINQALRSFVLPRSDRAYLTIMTFRTVYTVMALRFKHNTAFERKDRILAMLSPISMIVLPVIWLSLITFGYTLMYWTLSYDLTLREAFVLSGSSLMTLGFAFEDNLFIIILAFTQAALSMMLIALLIGYLPTMYSAFSEREVMVTKLETYAGSPPTPSEMIRRLDFTGTLYDPEAMREFWVTWQDWFVSIEENHTTLAPMNFFRSPKPDRHWVTAAGAVLDTASIIASSVNIEQANSAGIAIRSGYLALRSIADYFLLQYDPDPNPEDPITIRRHEFDEVMDKLVAQGIPLHPSRDECWRHFQGWRVNYDEVLVRLAQITTAPYAPWSSDRALDWRDHEIPETGPSVLDFIRPRAD